MTEIPRNLIQNYRRTLLENFDVWILIDEVPFKELYVRIPNCFVVAAASPDKAKDAGIRKHLNMVRYYMDVWDWNEIVAGL